LSSAVLFSLPYSSHRPLKRFAFNGAGEGSEAKFGAFLLGHGPLYRFDFILDPHQIRMNQG
jgi:hypothetical protein